MNIRLGDGLIAWRHKAIALTNIDSSSKVLCGIYMRIISQELPVDLTRNMGSEIAFSKSLPIPQGPMS